jgi:predicted  nucleic acid-binding Zn-ribbon protein
MSIKSDALRELHRIHQQRGDLNQRLVRGPRQVAAGQANVKSLEQQVDQAKQTLTKTKMANDSRELQLKEREGKIADLQKKLNSCNSNREYQALKEQIAADEQASSVLSDEILEGYDKIETEEQVVGEITANLEKAASGLEQLQTRVNAARDNLESELARVQDNLARAEQALPIEFQYEYKRMVKAHGEDALAAVEDETCQGCFQRITPQMYDQLRCSKAIFCMTCGRLLYLPEDTSVAG